MAIERAQALEHENATAHAELAVLRAHPDSTPHRAELQLPELTLALRRASDKLTLAEDALRERTAQFVDMQGDASRAHYAAENAFGVAAGARAREKEALVREHELMLRLRVAEEEGRMLDRAVREYADLVRALERRQSLPSSPPPPSPPPLKQLILPADGAHTSNGKPPEQDRSGESTFESLQVRKEGLHKLSVEFEGSNKALRDEIGGLQIEFDGARSELEAERKAAEEVRLRLSNALAELERLKHDDNAAAKMVSRYMYVQFCPLFSLPKTRFLFCRKFSQATTDRLQGALESLNARHAATTSTLHTQLASAQSALVAEQRQSARLRDVLDEATEQLARETYGRRREIALRLSVVGREDRLAEALRRWVRRAQETCAKEDVPIAERLNTVVRDAGELLSLVDGAATHEDMKVTLGPGIGSVARIVAAQDAVTTLVEELQVETERRMQLERVLGHSEVDDDGCVIHPEPHTPSPATKLATVATEATPEAVKVDAATSPICQSPSQASQAIEILSEDPQLLGPAPAELPETKSALHGLEHTPTTVATLHQPTPRSSIGSPAFLSPHSSPSSSSASFPVNIDSTIPAILSLQDTTLASTATNEPNTQRPPSSNSHSPLPSSQRYSQSDLLTELEKTKTRYDELQRAFRDCHLALRELNHTLQAVPPSTSSLPTSALQTILARLDDFNEDARVELEIRIADEERVARGYATLLAVPGAIASVTEAQDAESAVRAFVEGSDATVARAQSQFARKRDDLEHDIAAFKRAVHELSQAQAQAQVPPSPPPSSRPATPATTNTPSSWTSLAAGLFASGGPSRPASPSPTFGAVVTSPRTRRVVSSDSGPLAILQHQLRIPMPELHHHQAAISPSVRPGSRARTTSGMYMLGLGMRGGIVVPGERIPQIAKGLATSMHEAEDFEVE
jgi:hypothetical protein